MIVRDHAFLRGLEIATGWLAIEFLLPAGLLRRSMRVLSHCAFVRSCDSTEGGTISVLFPNDHLRDRRARRALD